MEKNNNLEKFRNKAGRPKGSGNVVQAETKKILADILNNELATLEERLNDLKPNERVKVTIELLKYIVPSLKAVEQTNVNDSTFKPIQIDFSKWQ